MTFRKTLCSLLFVFCLSIGTTVRADVVLVSEFFTGNIRYFDRATGANDVFATIDGSPGLSSLAYDSTRNILYASALQHGTIYQLDGRTGSLLGANIVGYGATGIAITSDGNVLVSDYSSGNVRIYEPGLTGLVDTIVTPARGTGGVGILGNGDILISTIGEGVYRYDGTDVSLFSDQWEASAQIASDGNGNIFIGHGIGQSSSVFQFDSNGSLVDTINISPDMVVSSGQGSSPGTSPGGVTFDSNGNLLIAVLGQSNPGDTQGERGGLFLFDVNGNLLETLATGSNAFSSVAYVTAVPEPGSAALILIGVAAGEFMRRKRGKTKESAQVDVKEVS